MRYEYGIETEDKRECRYGLVVEKCSSCLFETLCRLEKNNKSEGLEQGEESEQGEQVLDPNK